MYWYTLTPCDEWTDPLPPTGHEIVAALRNLLQDTIVTLRGSFLCRNNTLYFPNPLNDRTAGTLIPATWLPEPILWDTRKPVPLVSIDRFHGSSPDHSAFPDRYWLPFRAMLQRLLPYSLDDTGYALTNTAKDCLGNELGEQPWTIETQWHSSNENTCDYQYSAIERTIRLNPGWQFAIALDSVTHRRLRKLGEILLIYLGKRSQKFWLQPQEQSFQQQWRILQEQSERNRKMAEQRLNHQPEALPEAVSEATRVLAYLATPGVFERKHNGIVTCRNFPWEWDLAYPGNRHQPRGPMVSLATTHPIPISCQCLSRETAAGGITGFQVFAVSPGSVYYLEYPAELFQDQPFLREGRFNKAHLWRRLGYSELFWMPYPNYDTAVLSGLKGDRRFRSGSAVG